MFAIFGDTLKGSTVLDYGFGRGNWSTAFAQLGVKKVISVDISPSNVSKFKDYIAKNMSQSKIEVLVGDYSADFKQIPDHDVIWSYGVIQHLENPKTFFGNLSEISNPPQQGLLYAYEKNSLRSKIIGIFREFLGSPITPSLFLQNEFTNNRNYQRCVDDYCAPILNFFELHDILSISRPICHESTKFERIGSFADFLGKNNFDLDFSAIHLRFGNSFIHSPQIVYQKNVIGLHDKPILEFLENLVHILSLKNGEMDLQDKIVLTTNFHNFYYDSFSEGKLRFVEKLPHLLDVI